MASKKRALIVDDNRTCRLALDKILTKAGFETIQAEDGKAGLEAYSQQDFDIIFLDIVMPEIDGLEALRAIRETSSREELPVYVVSSKDTVFDREQAEIAGANGYFLKPIEKTALEKELTSIFS